MISEFLRRLRYYLRRGQFETELDEEMRHHLAMKERDSGATALQQFGNVTLLKEDSRAMWAWTFWEQLLQDIRYAIRSMNANRAFTALAVLSPRETLMTPDLWCTQCAIGLLACRGLASSWE
jgi:macrolide transport system ATP-binding/permease protein